MRYVYMAVGAIVALVVIVAVIGWMLPVKHRASVARVYQATPASLFSLVTDVSAFPSWRTGVSRVDTLPDENGHRRWKEITKNGPPITFMVERVVPDRVLLGRIADTNLPFGGSWSYELTPAAAGQTKLTITEDGEVYNPIFRFVSRFVMGHEATINQYLSDVGKRFREIR
jgi:uncharacterized protein YndB with AHSA1/START domain